MTSSKVAIRYARSLYQHAKDKNVLDNVFADIQMLSQTINQVKEFKNVLSNPVISVEKKKAIFQKIGQKLHQETQNFLHMIVVKGRTSQLQGICHAFADLHLHEKGIIMGEIQSVVPLDKKVVSRIEKQLASFAEGKKMQLSNTIDPSLIGGFLVKFQDKLLDQSLKKPLSLIKQTITNN